MPLTEAPVKYLHINKKLNTLHYVFSTVFLSKEQYKLRLLLQEIISLFKFY